MWYLAVGLAARGWESHNLEIWWNSVWNPFRIFEPKWRYLVPGYQVTVIHKVSNVVTFLPSTNEVSGKVIFSQMHVCPPRGGLWPRAVFVTEATSPDLTVEKRAVRILLECILVVQVLMRIYWNILVELSINTNLHFSWCFELKLSCLIFKVKAVQKW